MTPAPRPERRKGKAPARSARRSPRRDERPAHSDPLPPPRLAGDEVETLRRVYIDLLGFVPPRIAARTNLLSRLDPEGLRLQEEMRRHFMYPACFDVKTAQLMLFGMLLMNLQDASMLHAQAARRAGATWEELSAVVGLGFLFRGLSAANLGAQILQEIAGKETQGGGSG